jgi:propanol-preferring alcohol dehydrogenase
MCLERPAPVEDAPLHLAERPLPKPGPGEVLLKVRACGVCHTDLHTVEGELELPRLPLVPGHQVVGMAEQVGPDVGRFRVGERVGVAWLHEACGRCKFCRTGRENLCPEARFTGLSVDGGYAEYLKAKADFAYRIPQGYDDQEAAPLLCAGIVGYRALRLSRIERGARLGLFGFGASAHIAIQVARHWDCRVYVFTRAAAHRRLAEELGAAWVGGAEDDPGVALQSAVIFAPAGRLVPRALERLDRGGTLALAGITMTPLPQMDYRRHLYHERAVVSVANATRQDGEELMKLAGEIRLRTHVEAFPLAEANRVLQLLKQSRIQASAVLEMHV